VQTAQILPPIRSPKDQGHTSFRSHCSMYTNEAIPKLCIFLKVVFAAHFWFVKQIWPSSLETLQSVC